MKINVCIHHSTDVLKILKLCCFPARTFSVLILKILKLTYYHTIKFCTVEMQKLGPWSHNKRLNLFIFTDTYLLPPSQFSLLSLEFLFLLLQILN